LRLDGFVEVGCFIVIGGSRRKLSWFNSVPLNAGNGGIRTTSFSIATVSPMGSLAEVTDTIAAPPSFKLR
jgi:hypothetical protein